MPFCVFLCCLVPVDLLFLSVIRVSYNYNQPVFSPLFYIQEKVIALEGLLVDLLNKVSILLFLQKNGVHREIYQQLSRVIQRH